MIRTRFTIGELKYSRLGVYNDPAIVRRYNNNKLSLKSFKKLSKLRLRRQIAIISFKLKLQSVLSGRRVRRRVESGGL